MSEDKNITAIKDHFRYSKTRVALEVLADYYPEDIFIKEQLAKWRKESDEDFFKKEKSK